MKKHGRKQKLKRASEFDLIYAKRNILLSEKTVKLYGR